MQDKCYLSLDGIANGDIPATAITGFGFHVQEYRPVADVKLIRNIGLRPSPPPVSLIIAAFLGLAAKSEANSLLPYVHPYSVLTDIIWLSQGSVIAISQARRFSRARSIAPRRSASQGLGISDNTLQLSRSRPKPTAPNHSTGDISIGNGDAYSLEVQEVFKHMALSPHRRDVIERFPSSIVRFEVACLTPLPPQTGEELTAISMPLTASGNSEID